MLTVNRLHQTNLPTWQHLTAATLCAQTQQQSAVCCWWQLLAIGAVWPQVQLLHWFLSVIKWEEQFTPLCYSYTVGLQSVAPCSRWFWIMHLPLCNTGVGFRILIEPLIMIITMTAKKVCIYSVWFHSFILIIRFGELRGFTELACAQKLHISDLSAWNWGVKLEH